MRHFFIAAAILFALAGGYFALFNAGSAPPQGADADAQAGEQVFAAAFPDAQGAVQPLAQWRGKVMVLNFWATWCPPCRKEMPGFVKLQQKYGAQGLVFIGVAVDTKENVQAFLRETPINYPILIGPDSAVELSAALGNRQGGLPYSVILDRQGKLIASHVGELSEDKLEEFLLPLLR